MAVIGPLTKTPHRTIKVDDCVEVSAWSLHCVNVGPEPALNPLVRQELRSNFEIRISMPFLFCYHSNRVTGIYELSLCKMSDTGSPGEEGSRVKVLKNPTLKGSVPSHPSVQLCVRSLVSSRLV